MPIQGGVAVKGPHLLLVNLNDLLGLASLGRSWHATNADADAWLLVHIPAILRA